MRYAIRLRKDTNGTYLVTVPDLPEAITFGETPAEAKLQAIDAIETAMMSRIADREAIPLPKAKGKYHVDLRPAITAKIALWNAMLKQGLGKAALARKLKWHLPQVDRVLDVRHESTISTLTDALTAAGYALSVSVSPSRNARKRHGAREAA
ncbi:MAG: type II toxin-antitoxin system HicB family antitoxin [Rhizobiales bacterium]|nr:type II toxin-antitoxin system HicB family antitoxin [Hyphomicrobiales bacterium]